jgi:hypothetical protein
MVGDGRDAEHGEDAILYKLAMAVMSNMAKTKKKVGLTTSW